MHGIEPQAVDVEFVDPISGIGDEKLANGTAMLGVEIDPLTPIGVMPPRDVFGRELPEIIPPGPKWL